MNEYNKGYDEGFQQGLAAAEFTDGYWLRCYAGQAMQGMLANGDHMDAEGIYYTSAMVVITEKSVKYAKALMKELEVE